uniref:Uncharacterized protein n=1 Tax=Candidatus Methanogaster sp. ANME-2c ERB4 TaxID=2759911 RepID=A0A7G9Y0E7_9EURY|nr:hypothetical protein PCHDJDJP_00003 [Methanosarcinales archaeon ANME-2c ERB4]QNO42087.1 hypothetical protein NOEFNAIN_00019 [Methanosarcinales archaeon ANME-2c ERB4]QNO42643.1 hypothetical protein LNAFDGMD_00003 [Methanosarcinales archaeon ANME-2c ERB4]QNO48252.1 hypothetical protein BHCKGNAA_00038 [Methanosarcinales archaeon ANME-2c ERB4]
MIRSRIRPYLHHIRTRACKREMRCSDVHVLIVNASRNTDRIAPFRSIDRRLYLRHGVCIEPAAVSPPAGLVDADVAAVASEYGRCRCRCRCRCWCWCQYRRRCLHVIANIVHRHISVAGSVVRPYYDVCPTARTNALIQERCGSVVPCAIHAHVK